VSQRRTGLMPVSAGSKSSSPESRLWMENPPPVPGMISPLSLAQASQMCNSDFSPFTIFVKWRVAGRFPHSWQITPIASLSGLAGPRAGRRRRRESFGQQRQQRRLQQAGADLVPLGKPDRQHFPGDGRVQDVGFPFRQITRLPKLVDEAFRPRLVNAVADGLPDVLLDRLERRQVDALDPDVSAASPLALDVIPSFQGEAGADDVIDLRRNAGKLVGQLAALDLHDAARTVLQNLLQVVFDQIGDIAQPRHLPKQRL